MKIGDEVYIHGYVDEIRKDVVIIRNDGGYFGTVPSEVITADRKTENSSEKPNNSTTEDCSTVPTISKMEQVDEPQLTPNYCGTCKHREVPCGDLPCDVCHSYSRYEPKDEPQTDCAWK